MQEPKPKTLFQLNTNPELYFQLDAYRKSLGWTWTRFILVGLGEIIAKQGTNPELALSIVEHLTKRR